MNKFQRSWLLLKSSLSVIVRNKQLLVFPAVIFVCTVAIVAFFLAPPEFALERAQKLLERRQLKKG